MIVGIAGGSMNLVFGKRHASSSIIPLSSVCKNDRSTCDRRNAALTIAIKSSGDNDFNLAAFFRVVDHTSVA